MLSTLIPSADLMLIRHCRFIINFNFSFLFMQLQLILSGACFIMRYNILLGFCPIKVLLIVLANPTLGALNSLSRLYFFDIICHRWFFILFTLYRTSLVFFKMRIHKQKRFVCFDIFFIVETKLPLFIFIKSLFLLLV
jgi:hypothetical protein